MKMYQVFLAYYTFIVSISLFIWAVIFAPKPDGFFLALLLSPMSIYFYLLISGGFKKSQQDFAEEYKRINIKFYIALMVVFFLSSFAIFFYSVSNQNTLSKEIDSLKKSLLSANQKAESYKETSSGLTNVKSVIAVANSEESEETNTQAGSLTISDAKNSTVSVYEEKSLTSNIVGIAEYGKNYTFIEKDQDWYLILLPDDDKEVKEGYISSLYVEEVE